MANTAIFLAALKRCLKAQGVTYKALAKPLGISEASVKRIFAEGSLSLERIGIVLDVLGMSFLDVAKLTSAESARDDATLSFEQESVLAADEKLFTVFHLLLFGQKVDGIRGAERCLAELEALGLIERKANGKITALKSRNIKWREDGPLRKAYGARIRAEFLAQELKGEREISVFRTRSLSAGSQALVKRRLEALLRELDELSDVDCGAARTEVRPTAVMLAFGPFHLSLMAGRRPTAT